MWKETVSICGDSLHSWKHSRQARMMLLGRGGCRGMPGPLGAESKNLNLELGVLHIRTFFTASLVPRHYDA